MRSAIIAALTLACACGGDATELLVVIDSNLAVPGELDEVRVFVDGQSATGSLAGPRSLALPRTVGIVHTGGALGPVEVRTVGYAGGTPIVERIARTNFVEGKTLVLPMFLDGRCRLRIGEMACPTGETCVEGRCESSLVPPATLAEYDGTLVRPDAGLCPNIVAERCNGRDDDCDDAVDEGFDTQTDPLNCGACNTACAAPNAESTCAGGVCSIATCSAGFGDCNADPADGCEASLDSVEHCGSCGTTCALPNASGSCIAAMCVLGDCDPGFADCNAVAEDGCETSTLTLTDCGGCGVVCAPPGATSSTCEAGACQVDMCESLLGDCDSMAANGCEQPLTELAHCGACGAACMPANGVGTCATGACAITTCNPGFGDCDSMVATGCEQSLTTLAHCGGCGVTCALPNATATCTTGTCEVDTCSAERGNCDGIAANGCEVDLDRDDNHCGTCGNACDPGDRCRFGRCF